MCRRTGSGQRLFIGFLIPRLDRQRPTPSICDKARGLEIRARALGAEYLPLKNGVATGFNPLQLPLIPANVEFLMTLLPNLSAVPLQSLLAGSALETSDRDQALRVTLVLNPEGRRLSRLLHFLRPTNPQ